MMSFGQRPDLYLHCLIAALLFAVGCGSQPHGGRSAVPATTPSGSNAAASSLDMLVVSEFPDGTADHTEPSLPTLSDAEQRALLKEVEAVPRMSVFLPSSCHDRAHALWMLLSKEFQAKVAKTWIFSESAYTSVLRGGVMLKDAAMKPWRYHVALVFRDNDGQMSVLDPVREDWPRPVSISEWQGRIGRSPKSLLPLIRVTLSPKLYLFYGHSMTAPANFAGAINTGEFFEYADVSRDNDFIPRSLSRDDVAVSDVARECPELRDVLADADRLQNILNCARKEDDAVCTIPGDDTKKAAFRQTVSRFRESCPSTVNLYQNRLDFWKSRLL